LGLVLLVYSVTPFYSVTTAGECRLAGYALSAYSSLIQKRPGEVRQILRDLSKHDVADSVPVIEMIIRLNPRMARQVLDDMANKFRAAGLDAEMERLRLQAGG